MKFSKSKILPFIGLLVTVFFITMSYFNNHIFLDKIILCSLILGMVFFVKMKGEIVVNQSDANNSASTDLT